MGPFFSFQSFIKLKGVCVLSSGASVVIYRNSRRFFKSIGKPCRFEKSSRFGSDFPAKKSWLAGGFKDFYFHPDP